MCLNHEMLDSAAALVRAAAGQGDACSRTLTLAVEKAAAACTGQRTWAGDEQEDDLRFPEPLQCLSTSGSLKLPSYVCSCAVLMASLVKGTRISGSPL